MADSAAEDPTQVRRQDVADRGVGPSAPDCRCPRLDRLVDRRSVRRDLERRQAALGLAMERDVFMCRLLESMQRRAFDLVLRGEARACSERGGDGRYPERDEGMVCHGTPNVSTIEAV